MNTALRKATLTDIPDIVKIHRDIWRDVYRICVPAQLLDNPNFMTPAYLSKQTADFIAKDNVYVACGNQNKVLGFAIWQKSGEINRLYVNQKFARKGIGSALFSHALKTIRESEQSPFVWTITNYQPANNFYLKMGGKLTETKFDQRLGIQMNKYQF